MKKYNLYSLLLITLIIVTSNLKLSAQNPVCPIGTYVADPTARVWKDGNLYIYGSTDVALEHWCSYKHDVLYSADLKDWYMKSDVFTTKGKNDQVKDTDDLLFAPDAIYRDGKYYLYFCTPDVPFSEGVATSDSPLGPFINGKKIDLFGHNQIDPTIFIDDDGQAYYYWGQYDMKGAKVKENMQELDQTSLKTGLLTNKEHFFHEGAFVFKRNDIYYVVYAYDGRRGAPTCLAYATSNSPLGPFKYGGVIVDNYGCDPASWNNHGSVAKFGDQWYVFYHRSSHKSAVMRRACIEPIEFNEDGSIDEVEMTSQGAGSALDAFNTIDAERACTLTKGAYITRVHVSNEIITSIQDSSVIAYKYLDFGKGAKEFEAVIGSYSGGKINIRIDGPQGEIVGTLDVEPSVVGGFYKKYKCKIRKTKGIHSLYLECLGGEKDSDLFEIDEFKFI